ncbi:MAG: VOC family protein [Sediminicola sp.]|tara:strand:- start:5408 stop:5794 length:387 start_codon:yes stop_codon:yes gene_type:complete
MKKYKPEGHNSLSPYLVVKDAPRLVKLLKEIFGATEQRRYDRADGSIMHIELKLDDSILMISDSTSDYPPNTTMLHIYVPDVFKTFETALEKGCEPVERPVNKPGDPDTRGSFNDYAGNSWWVSSQTE